MKRPPAGCPVGRTHAVPDELRAAVRALLPSASPQHWLEVVMTVTVATLGFPRIGPKRELKTALESHWAGKIDATALLAVAADLRARAWRHQRDLGANLIPSNDFSLYDHVLDTTAMVGAIPAIGRTDGTAGLATYFAIARGAQGNTGEAACAHGHAHDGDGAPAAEMTKWFDTNYHYLVPEFTIDQSFRLGSTKAVREYLEAKALGIETRPVLLGPVTYLLLGKTRGADFDPLTLLPRLLPVYMEMLRLLASAGATWIQIDEPCLVMDLTAAARAAFDQAYAEPRGTILDRHIESKNFPALAMAAPSRRRRSATRAR
jgi:5-methyltetrahydropteroyltriglutamate--homocysteine methyltransferase